MFSFFSQKSKGDSQTSIDENLKAVTENLYKQNLELAGKNKTLSLIRQLYQISIQTLTPKVLGGEIVKIVRDTLEFDLAGIFVMGEERNLTPLAFGSSDRLSKLQSESGHSFADYTIVNPEKSSFLNLIMSGKLANQQDALGDIWNDYIPAPTAKLFVEEAHIKTTLGYPLIINNEIIGILILLSNRKFDDFGKYEKESLAIFADVIAAALDKAQLYEQLQITNDKLAQANVRLKELDQQKSEFVSIAGHQLRTPLTIIKGYVSLAQEGSFGETKQNKKLDDALTIVANSTSQLEKLVSDLLDLSRIESGKMHYEFKETDFGAMVESIVKEYTPAAQAKKLNLVFENNAKDLAPFLFDPDKMREVVVNLIDNAMKYSTEGDIVVGIQLINQDQNQVLRFSVKDEGLGIKPEDISKLFIKFNRMAEAKSMQPNGSGIGLFFVKRLVEDHGGRIGVESPGPGKGSTFWAQIPLTRQVGSALASMAS